MKYTVAYDRSALIDRAVKTLEEKLIEESIVVALVCLAFLLHLRSALVAIIILPVAVLISFLVMFGQGISSNIMSLGGIAIAIGAMVDAVIIMIENAHKHLERDQGKKPHWEIIRDAVDRGRADAVLFAAGHHGFVPAGVHVAGAGRPAVQAAGVHQDLFHGRGGAAVHHARAGADGLVHPRQNSEGGKKPDQPVADLALPPGRWILSSNGAGWWWWAAALLVGWVFFPWNSLVARLLPRGRVQGMGVQGAAKFFRIKTSARNSCRRFTRATCFTCPRRFPASRPTKAREILQITDRIIKSFPEVRNRLWQGRPRRNRHRSRADGHD